MFRVVFFVDSPSARAHANAASRLAAGIAESGTAEAALLCYSDDPAPAWLPAQVRVDRLGVDRASRSIPGLVRYLRDHRPEVLVTRQVHANFIGLAAAAIARTGFRWRGKLILVQDHPVALSHAANRRDNKWLAKLTYRFADGVISPSPTVQDDIVAWSHLDPAATAVVPNPIPKFTGPAYTPPHPWLKDGEPPVFVNTSNMMPWKRLDLLIEAFAEVRRRHQARLILIGTGPERDAADAKIRELGLVGEAETVGWVEDPLQYAACAHAYVHASDEEGFAQVLTEAMSVSCPVVVTDAQGGGPRFVTEDGKYGLLVPRGDRAALAAAMEQMLATETRAEYSRLGLERSAEMSPAASAGVFLDFLGERLGLR